MENRKAAIEWFSMLKEKFVKTEYEGYLDMAISALEKQEKTIDKSCEACKHKDRLVSEWRCCECFRASNLEDYWEPYMEDEA